MSLFCQVKRGAGALLTAGLLAGPAAAHTGPHLHPHGSESWFAVVFGAVVIVGGAIVMWRGR
ncbi:MAG: hypothetical protein AAFY38_07730 [Pseudomonadota bacterium]